MNDRSKSRNPFWRLVTLTGGLFAFTAMVMFATALGDPAAPPNRFLDAWGVPLIVVETLALVVVSFLAMAVDSRQDRGTTTAASAPASLPPTAPPEDTP